MDGLPPGFGRPPRAAAGMMADDQWPIDEVGRPRADGGSSGTSDRASGIGPSTMLSSIGSAGGRVGGRAHRASAARGGRGGGVAVGVVAADVGVVEGVVGPLVLGGAERLLGAVEVRGRGRVG